MQRKKASDFPQELLDLFDGYVHGGMTAARSWTARRSSRSAASARRALFEMLRPNYAWAIQVPPDDKRIVAKTVDVPSPQGNGCDQGLSGAAGDRGKLPAVLVVHENRGLNPYIEDVARRLAIANFIAFAPDGLTSVGGYPGDDEKGAALVQAGRPGQDAGGFPRRRRVAENPARFGRAKSARSASASAAASSTSLRSAWARGSTPQFPSMACSRAPPTRRRSRRRSTPNTANSTRASPAAGRPSTPNSPRPACRTKGTSTRAPTTASTTTRRPATTRRRRKKPGKGRSTGSTNICRT